TLLGSVEGPYTTPGTCSAMRARRAGPLPVPSRCVALNSCISISQFLSRKLPPDEGQPNIELTDDSTCTRLMASPTRPPTEHTSNLPHDCAASPSGIVSVTSTRLSGL